MQYGELIKEQVGPILPRLATKPDETLLEEVGTRFVAAFSDRGLYGGSVRDRISEWANSSLRQACDTAGDAGRTVWQILVDHESAHNVERVAIIVGFLTVHFFGLRDWHFEELIAFSILLVRLLSRERSE